MHELEPGAVKYIEEARKKFEKKTLSILSQQCIGGVIYHDMGMQFLSPTINLYLNAKDFLTMVENIEYYMKLPVDMKMENGKIVGYLEDLRIVFMHYTEIENAKQKWEERKTRILWDKIFVICSDRDGFDEECFERFQKLKYPKALVARNPKWKNEKFCVYLEKYSEEEYIPDTIPTREFYENNKIIELLNQAYR